MPTRTSLSGWVLGSVRTICFNAIHSINRGLVDNFDLPKLHSNQHYDPFVEDFGTMDNYNTETSERLHIDFAKEAFRASNKRDYVNQMISFIDRREKLWAIGSAVRREDERLSPETAPIPSSLQGASSKPSVDGSPVYSIQLAKSHVGKATFQELKEKYRAYEIEAELSLFIARYSHLQTTGKPLRRRPKVAAPLLFSEVNIWHHLKFHLPNFQTPEADGDYIEDKTTITPVGDNGTTSGFFPTVVVVWKAEKLEETGMAGTSASLY
jgi:hypothetical protein